MAHNQEVLNPIYDVIKVTKLRVSLEHMLQYLNDGRLALFKKQGWVAVPVESSYHLSSTGESRLLEAISRHNGSVMWALALEALENFPPAFEVPATMSGIKEFNHKCAHFNFSLFSEGESWIGIFTTNEYYIVAGPIEFVRTVVGGNLEEAFERFYSFATDPQWPKPVTDMLLSVLNSLRHNYSRAEAGALVPLTAMG